MNITLKASYSGYDLIFETENVKVTEDIEERIYSKTEEGKTDYKVPPKRDIKTDALDQFTQVFEDIIYYRKADYDSSDLIERLFDKLPQDTAEKLAKKLNDNFNS